MSVLILDSEPLSQLVNAGAREFRVRAYLEAAWRKGYPVRIPAAVLSELYRGGRFDQGLDALLSRRERRSEPPAPSAFGTVDTDRPLARLVGNLLAAADRSSSDHVDACTVAACLQGGGGWVLTGDPDDLEVLATHAVGVEVVTP